MKLDKALSVKVPDNSKNPPAVRTLQDLTEATISIVIDNPIGKTVHAVLKGFPVPVLLWGKADYDKPEAQWTVESAQAKVDALYPTAASLMACLPKHMRDLSS